MACSLNQRSNPVSVDHTDRHGDRPVGRAHRDEGVYVVPEACRQCPLQLDAPRRWLRGRTKAPEHAGHKLFDCGQVIETCRRGVQILHTTMMTEARNSAGPCLS